MSCCDETTARVPPTDVSRRSILKGAAVITALVPAASRSEAQGRSIKLAYCSQLLCGVPYEVARSGGHFKNHGLNVELVYTRGGSAAMQALVGGAVDYGRPRSTSPSPPSAMPAQTSAALQSPVGCPCSRSSPRPRPQVRSQTSRHWKARPSAFRRSATPITR